MQTQAKTHRTIRNLVFSALCLGLCLVLPFLTGQIPQIGNMLCPMHIPVLLSGFLCGPWWAMAIGLVAPALRFILFSMPAPIPTGLAMTFELAAYGLTAGLLYRIMPKKIPCIYVSLIGAMLMGAASSGALPVSLFTALWEIRLPGLFFLQEPLSMRFQVSLCISF